MRSRLEALEKLFAALKTQDAQEAEQLVQRIRSEEELTTILEDKGEKGGLPIGRGREYRDQSLSAPSSSGLTPYSVLEDPTLSGSSTGSLSDVRRAAAAVAAAEPLGRSPVGTPWSSQRWPSPQPEWPAINIRDAMPDSTTAQNAIDTFFGFSGKLLYVFSQEHAQNLYNDVFSLPPKEVDATAVCCVAALCAIGVRHQPGMVTAAEEKNLYNLSRHYLEDVILEDPLAALKVITLLAMFNVVEKATIALIYVGKQASYHVPLSRPN